MQGGKVFIWMNLLGFERNDADKGARRFLEQTGFVPDGACALMCHPDFFHQHRGMSRSMSFRRITVLIGEFLIMWRGQDSPGPIMIFVSSSQSSKNTVSTSMPALWAPTALICTITNG